MLTFNFYDMSFPLAVFYDTCVLFCSVESGELSVESGLLHMLRVFSHMFFFIFHFNK